MATHNRYLVHQRLRTAAMRSNLPAHLQEVRWSAEILGVSRKPSRHFTSTRSSTLFHPVIVEIQIFTCGEVRARRSMGQKLSNDDLEIVAFKGQEAVVA